MAAVYYNVEWISTAVQSTIELYCTRDMDERSAKNCRDALLVLQENITYSAERPNPGYKPYDQSIFKLTQTLCVHLMHCFMKGLNNTAGLKYN